MLKNIIIVDVLYASLLNASYNQMYVNASAYLFVLFVYIRNIIFCG